MAEFKNQLIHFNESEYEKSLKDLNGFVPFYQECINEYNDLNIQNPFKPEDFVKLFENPRVFLAEKLMNGEEMYIGALKVSSEALFEMIEKPENYLAYIAKMESRIKSDEGQKKYIWPLEKFQFSDNNKVEIKTEIIEKTRKAYSISIESPDEKKYYDLACSIVENLNELKKVYPQISTKFLDECVIVPDNIFNRESTFKVCPTSIIKFRNKQ